MDIYINEILFQLLPLPSNAQAKIEDMSRILLNHVSQMPMNTPMKQVKSIQATFLVLALSEHFFSLSSLLLYVLCSCMLHWVALFMETGHFLKHGTILMSLVNLTSCNFQNLINSYTYQCKHFTTQFTNNK